MNDYKRAILGVLKVVDFPPYPIDLHLLEPTNTDPHCRWAKPYVNRRLVEILAVSLESPRELKGVVKGKTEAYFFKKALLLVALVVGGVWIIEFLNLPLLLADTLKIILVLIFFWRNWLNSKKWWQLKQSLRNPEVVNKES